jgi:(2Fe-2S) ferredoxin
MTMPGVDATVFASRLHRVPHRHRYLAVCVNHRPEDAPRPCCARQGGREIHAKLKALLAKRGLATTEVRAVTTSCLDLCDEGPVIVVEPDHFVYRRVTLEDVDAIVDALASGTRVERLVMPGGLDRAPPLRPEPGENRS